MCRNTLWDSEDSDSISCEGLSYGIRVGLVIFVSECMKNLGNEVDEENEEELSVESFSISFDKSVVECPVSVESTLVDNIIVCHIEYYENYELYLV